MPCECDPIDPLVSLIIHIVARAGIPDSVCHRPPAILLAVPLVCAARDCETSAMRDGRARKYDRERGGDGLCR